MSLLSTLRDGIERVRERYRTRETDHYEIRWRPPDGRGWRQVDDPDEVFDPSAIEEPIPVDHFRSHATTQGYYRGEYRLVPINEQGQMIGTVWQVWFEAGPSLAAERRAEERKQERLQQVLEQTKAISEELRRRERED